MHSNHTSSQTEDMSQCKPQYTNIHQNKGTNLDSIKCCNLKPQIPASVLDSNHLQVQEDSDHNCQICTL